MPIGSMSAHEAQQTMDRHWQIMQEMSDHIKRMPLDKAEEMLKMAREMASTK